MSIKFLKFVLLVIVLSGCQDSAILIGHNLSFIQNLLRRIGRTVTYRTTPIFLGEHLLSNDVNHIMQWLSVEVGIAIYIFTSNSVPEPSVGPLHQHITPDTLGILFTSNIGEEIWWHMDQHLRKLRQAKLLVVLASEYDDSISLIFTKLWQLQFLNVIVLHRENIYGYTPYPEVNSFRIIDDQAELFSPAKRNFRGYIVSTPAENDVPRVFLIKDPRTNLVKIRGFGYRIFKEFLHRHNATLEISNAGESYSIYTSVNMSHINHMIGKQKLEISLHPYVGIEKKDGILSYPLLKAVNCLIVPVRNELPRYMYLMRPFHWSCYVLLFVAVLYIAYILYWLKPASRQPNTRCNCYMNSFLESLAQLMFLSSITRVYHPEFRYFFVALQLAILGFFITTWYSNLLGSFLTTFLVGEQVDSFQQLIDAKLPILMKYYERGMLLQQVPPNLENQISCLIVGVNASVQVKHLLSFNRSYCFPFTIERWQFFALQQQFANKPIYRWSSICLGAPIIAYPMRNDSHFEPFLNQFIMDTQMAGLFDYWLTSDFADALKAGYVRLIDNELPIKALDMETFTLAWCIVVCGWFIATLAFAGEHWIKAKSHRIS